MPQTPHETGRRAPQKAATCDALSDAALKLLLAGGEDKGKVAESAGRAACETVLARAVATDTVRGPTDPALRAPARFVREISDLTDSEPEPEPRDALDTVLAPLRRGWRER